MFTPQSLARLLTRFFCLALVIAVVPAHVSAVQAKAPTSLPAAGTPSASAQAALITVTDEGFSPASITLVAGAQVAWYNGTAQRIYVGSIPWLPATPANPVYLPLVMTSGAQSTAGAATAVAQPGAPDWTSEAIEPGGTYSRVLTEVGTFSFYASHLYGVAGAVTVVDSVARIEIAPAAALLTAVGETKTLKAVAFDNTGREIFAPTVWLSSDPAQVAVSTGGEVKAVAPTGSALVYASYGAITSAPATVLVASPASGAHLVYDDEVVQQPSLADPAAEPGLGTLYRATLQGSDLPSIGEIIVGAEGSPILGRVVSLTPAAGGTEVVYEAVALTDVFQHLQFEEHVDLQQAPLLADALVAAGATVDRDTQGQIIVRYSGAPSNVHPDGPDQVAFDLGPFRCDASAGIALQGSLIEVTFENNLGLDFAVQIHDWSLERLLVQLEGSLTTAISGGIDLTAAATGSVSCRMQRVAAWIPIGGPLAAVITPVIPIGAGFDVEGELRLANLRVALIGEVETTLKFGFDWYPGTTLLLVNDFDVTNNSRFDLNQPNLATDFGFKGHILTCALTGLGISLFPDNLTGNVTWNVIDLKAGPKQNLDLRVPLGQATDDYYASQYDLALEGKVGVGPDLQKLVNHITGKSDWLDMPQLLGHAASLKLVLAESPHGMIGADMSSTTVGRPVAFQVALDPTDLSYPLLGYNVNEVRIYRLISGQLQLMATLPAAADQERFTWQWLPSAADIGTIRFVAFVVSRALSFVPLELDDYGATEVLVQSEQPTPTPVALLEDFSQSALGSFPAGWSAMGSGQFTPSIVESGGSGTQYHVLDFPEVGWEYWDKWAIRNGVVASNVYTAQVKLRFLNSVADRAGLTVAMNRDTLARIDIQPNVYTNQIEFRSSFGGTVSTLATIAVDAGTDYWLRAVGENQGPNAGKISVYWSTNGTTFAKVLEVTGLSTVSGEVGVSTAGPHMPHTQFDDFRLTYTP